MTWGGRQSPTAGRRRIRVLGPRVCRAVHRHNRFGGILPQ